MERKLLIVEDDPGLQSQMRWCFENTDVQVADNREAALALLRRFEPQVVTLDLGLPPDPGGSSEGFALLQDIVGLAPNTKVIVVTGREEKQHAVEAIGMGAADFFQKPLDADILTFIVDRAFRIAQLEKENQQLASQRSHSPLEGVIAASPEMLRVCRTVEKVAPADVSTLINGETGTGKEVLAKALHSLSGRKDQPFAAINCAAIPENLLETELFGHEKGAFTGAVQAKKGKVELAHGGTLFLDEIGDMPMPLQAKMLRFLQEREIERVGGVKGIPVDVRVICATHRNIEELIAAGDFREDLYYRISEITVRVPALRERAGDAVLIANALLKKFSADLNKQAVRFSAQAAKAIEQYQWPGNVRELINKVKRAIIMADGKQIEAEDLELDAPKEAQPAPTGKLLNLRQVREEAEQGAILQALNSTGYNMAQAARLLGVTRPTLYNLTGKYNIPTSP